MSAFKMLSKFIRAFLPRSKHLLVSWLQSPSVVILDSYLPRPLGRGHIYSTMCKIDSYGEASVEHRELSLVL